MTFTNIVKEARPKGVYIAWVHLYNIENQANYSIRSQVVVTLSEWKGEYREWGRPWGVFYVNSVFEN